MNKKDLPIASPCGMSWTAMVGEDASRFCGSCQKHVHDLSQMTKAEAKALLAAPATAGLCVRYLHDDAGTIVFRPSDRDPLIAPSRLARVKRVAAAAAALALPLSLTACMGAAMPPRPTPAIAPSSTADVPLPAPTSPVTTAPTGASVAK